LSCITISNIILPLYLKENITSFLPKSSKYVKSGCYYNKYNTNSITKEQLESWGCKFDKLVVGYTNIYGAETKPSFDLVIDDKAKKIISAFSAQFATIDKLSKETLEPIVNELIKSNNTNFKGVGQPLRIALTGSKFGPGIYDIIISLGKEEVTKRLTNKKLG